VSHHQERKEKNCLNCNAVVAGRFCQTCGQENIEPKESFWYLATHFIHDLTHFDGKFFGTLKYLLFKPAFLSQEYLRGRRTSYLHPIRMYVFTSAFFFLIFFNFYQSKDHGNEKKEPVAKTIAELSKERIRLNNSILKNDTIAEEATITELKGKLVALDKDIQLIKKDSTKRDSILLMRAAKEEVYFNGETIKAFSSQKYYDSAQNALPKEKRDNFIVKSIQEKYFKLREKYNHDQRKIWEVVFEKFLHLFPQMLFVSLPLFALVLQLLYVRRKQFFYVDHVIFTIHLYCATFILILATLMFGSLVSIFSKTQWIVGTVGYLWICLYWYKAFRNFYSQSRKKTILKYVLLFFTINFLMAILFLAFLLLSFFEI
jgi:hypothetical protein